MIKSSSLTLGLVVAFALAIMSALVWRHIPDGARIAVHFDASGNANGYWSKTPALIFGPFIVFGLAILFAAVRSVRFKNEDIAPGSRVAFDVASLAAISIVGVAHVLILLHAEGRIINIGGVILPVVAVALMGTGNFLGKSQRNMLIGVRSPWTLASDYVWERTNRIGGRLFVLLGFLLLVLDAAASSETAMRALLIGAMTIAALLWGLSWHFWRNDPTRTEPHA